MFRRVRVLLFVLPVWLTAGNAWAQLTLFPDIPGMKAVDQQKTPLPQGITNPQPGTFMLKNVTFPGTGSTFTGTVVEMRTGSVRNAFEPPSDESLTIMVQATKITNSTKDPQPQGAGRTVFVSDDYFFRPEPGKNFVQGTLQTTFAGELHVLAPLNANLRINRGQKLAPMPVFFSQAEATTFGGGKAVASWTENLPNRPAKEPVEDTINMVQHGPYAEGTKHGGGTLKASIDFKMGPMEEYEFEAEFGSQGESTKPQIIMFVAMIPEPSTLMLLGIGSLALIGFAWKRRSRRA